MGKSLYRVGRDGLSGEVIYELSTERTNYAIM
jgi:hypothetical protein